MTGTLALAFDRVTGGYGTTIVIREITGAVVPGEVLCILGRNGVGKSTLIKMLAGHVACRSGAVRLFGEDVTRLSAPARHRHGMSYAPQERIVFDNLSVRDNLRLGDRPLDPHRFAECLAAFPILEERMRQLAGTLSGGERKILSFVRALCEGSPLVLLDEPTEGVQLENIQRMSRFIAAAKGTGTAFAIVEQHLSFALEIADRLLVMDQGRTVLQAQANDVERDQVLKHLKV